VALAQTLNGKKRTIKSKGYLKQMRRDGQIPGVIYGNGTEAIPIALSERQVIRIFNRHGARGLFSLEIERENPYMVLIRDLQKNPLNGKVIHIDFLTVNMNEKVNSSIIIHISGEEEVIKRGGILQAGTKEVEISCLPQDLPDHITCDVSNLQIGDKITIGDLEVDEKIEIISEPGIVIASVLAPSKAVEDVEAVDETDDTGAEGEATEE